MRVIPRRTCPQRDPVTMLTACLTLLSLLAALYTWWVRTPSGQHLDSMLFARAQTFNVVLAPPAALLRQGLLPLGAITVGLLTIAATRRRAWCETASAAAVIAVSVGMSAMLKTTLGRPFFGDDGYRQNTFPSGHVTVVAALAVGAVLLWPSPRPPLVPVTAAGASVLAAVASVVGFAHRPSDVVGSILTVLLVTAAVLWLSGIGGPALSRSQGGDRRPDDGALPAPGARQPPASVRS